jgi:hypothetical protein
MLTSRSATPPPIIPFMLSVPHAMPSRMRTRDVAAARQAPAQAVAHRAAARRRTASPVPRSPVSRIAYPFLPPADRASYRDARHLGRDRELATRPYLPECGSGPFQPKRILRHQHPNPFEGLVLPRMEVRRRFFFTLRRLMLDWRPNAYNLLLTSPRALAPRWIAATSCGSCIRCSNLSGSRAAGCTASVTPTAV